MEKRIITISREFGSGGRFIGEEVAKKLGIAYYDKDMIGQIAEQSGLSPEYIKENAELSPKKGLFVPYHSINHQLQKSEAFQSVHHVTFILCYTVLYNFLCLRCRSSFHYGICPYQSSKHRWDDITQGKQ